MSNGGVRCERCGNAITAREGIWVQLLDGRLRITTLDHLDQLEADCTRVWHAGCLHSPYR